MVLATNARRDTMRRTLARPPELAQAGRRTYTIRHPAPERTLPPLGERGSTPVLMLAFVLVAACDPSASDELPPSARVERQGDLAPASEMGALVGTNVLWGEYYNTGNATALIGLYLDDAVVMQPSGDLVGREAILAYYRQLFESRTDSIVSSSVDTEALDVAGDRAYEAGTISYQVREAGADQPTDHRVRYVTFWQRTADGWRIRRTLRTPLLDPTP